MKPVEYEEPKNLSSGSELDDTSSSSSAASSSSSSTSSSDSAASDGATAPTPAGGSCKDKKCGQACSDCPPGDENCMEILVLKQCDSKGACVPAPAECSSGSKDSKSKDKSKEK
jgi:hypothetical protein